MTFKIFDPDEKPEELDADVILVCVGRRPYTKDIGLETCGISVNERGQIPVDDNFMVIIEYFFPRSG